MKKMMKLVGVILSATVVSARAADGVWTVGSGVWTNTANWADGVVAGEGGKAAFTNATGGTVTVPSGYPFNLSAMYFSTNGATGDWIVTGETNTLVTPATLRIDTNTLFVSSSLSGSAGFQKTGGGTLKLQVPNPLLSGSAQILGGRVLIASDGYLGQVPASYQADAVVLDNGSLGNDDATVALAETRGVTLGSNGGYFFGRTVGNALVIASPIAGVGKLYVNMQTGYVALGNTNNAYAGDTVIGAAGPGYFGGQNALLKLDANEVIPDGAGAGSLVIDGTLKGVLDLNGKTETVNRLTGYSGAVIANSGSAAGLLRAGSDNTDTAFSGVLRAGVTLEKIGTGTLTYSNTAASAGLLKVSGGAVQAGSAEAISQTAVQLDGGSLKTPVASSGQRFLSPLLLSQDGALDRTGAAAAFVWSGPLLPTNAVGTPVLNVSGGAGPFVVGSTNRLAAFAIDAAVAGGVLFTNRVWLDTLPASSSWSIAPGADVAIGAPGLLGTGPMTLTSYSARLVASDSLGAGGETVTVQGTGNTVWFDATRDSAGRLSDDPAYAFTASNNVVFSGTAAQAGFDGAGTVTYTGTISGNGALVKAGGGDAVLQTANSFVGGVQVKAGRLLVSAGALGGSGNAITLAGGYLGSSGGDTVILSNTVTAAAGGLDVLGAPLELDGVVNGTVIKRGAGTLTLGGTAGNDALDLYVAQGLALLSKSGAAAVRNITGVDAGAVARLAGAGGNLIASNVTLTGGELDLNGISETIGALASASPASQVTNGGAAAVLTIGEGGAGGVFYGSLAASSLTLAKTGTNTFTLAGGPAGSQKAGALNVQNGLLALGAGVRYMRLTPGATRSGAAPAIGELQLTLRGRPLPWPSAASTTASSAFSTNNSWYVVDNNSRSYWQAASAPAWIMVDAKTPQLCDGYRWYTANADSGADPLNWTVEVSADGVNFVTADVRSNQTVTASRCALGAACAFGNAWPNDAASDAAAISVASGATLRMALTEDSAAALTGAGALALAEGSSLGVDDLSGFAGTVSGSGTLRLGGGATLHMPSAAERVTAVNNGAAPAAVTVGAAGEALFGGALADGVSAFGLTKQGGGTLNVIDAGSTYSGDTRVEQGTLTVQPGTPMWRFRYIRFNPTMTQNGNVPNSGYVLAISELQLTSNGVTVAYPAGRTITEVTRTANSDDNPTNAINGSTTDRWLSSVIPNPLTIDTKTGMTFNGYRIYTSGKNGADYGRTPADWTLQGSDDGVNWATLCAESGVPTPTVASGVGKLLGDFSVRTARFKLPLEFYAETNSAALKVAAVTARYLRFSVTDTRLSATDFANTGFQLDELQLMRNGAPLLYPAGTVASAPGDGYNDYGGRYFPPQMAVDNALPAPGTDTNRWYSVAMVNPMTVDMGQPVTFDAYRWYTGPNGTGRDPLGWKLEISNNTTNWYTLDVQTNQDITATRNVIAGTWPLNIPAGLLAADAVPDRSRTYVASGATLRIEAASETVGPLSGTGTVSLAASTLGINGFEDAAYAGGMTGAGTVDKTGSATQSLSGVLGFSGDIVVDAGTLDLTGATLTGVTNIVIRTGAELTGSATVNGNLTVTCEGGVYSGSLAVSGALTVVGTVKLDVPDGAAYPYYSTLFSFASANQATRDALLNAIKPSPLPVGYAATIRLDNTSARLIIAPAGTLISLW